MAGGVSLTEALMRLVFTLRTLADAFQSCASLTSVVIPSSTTSLGRYIFQTTGNLHSIELPSTLTELGTYVLSSSGIRSIVVPSGVTAIRDCTPRSAHA